MVQKLFRIRYKVNIDVYVYKYIWNMLVSNFGTGIR
jgi:hypothetical protein